MCFLMMEELFQLRSNKTQKQLKWMALLIYYAIWIWVLWKFYKSPSFSSTRLSLINRDIIWVTAHIRGGMERGMKWWKEGKLTKQKKYFRRLSLL